MSELTQHEKDLLAIAEFRMFDDTFMSAVFDGQINETELLLRVVLGREDIQVKSCEAQFYISNIYGREARLDILARDQSGKAYNVEVQRVLSGASVQRARFNSAMVDVMLLKKGKHINKCRIGIRFLLQKMICSEKGFLPIMPVIKSTSSIICL